MATDEDTIRFLVDAPEGEVRVKGSLPGQFAGAASSKVVELTADAVSEGVLATLQKFQNILGKISDADKLYSVSEVKLSLAVDARGEVSVVSLAKGSLGGRAELQFTLKRSG